MVDRLHAMLRSHLGPRMEKHLRVVTGWFSVSSHSFVFPHHLHHHHLIIDGPSTLDWRYTPLTSNVGRFPASTHACIISFLPLFFCLRYAAHCKTTHFVYHELYFPYLANSCLRYNRGKAYSPRILLKLHLRVRSRMRGNSHRTSNNRARAIRFGSQIYREMEISDAWKHLEACTRARVPTRDVPAYRARSQDPLRIASRQTGEAGQTRAPKSFFIGRKPVSCAFGVGLLPLRGVTRNART
jgi:hypothetical protein